MQFFIYFTFTEGQQMNPPTPEGMAQMSKLMTRAFDDGTIVATGQMPRTTTHIALHDGEFSLSDGPFTEGKEFIPGFTIIEAESKEKALEFAREMRSCMGNGVLRMAQLSATSKADIKM